MDTEWRCELRLKIFADLFATLALLNRKKTKEQKNKNKDERQEVHCEHIIQIYAASAYSCCIINTFTRSAEPGVFALTLSL